MKKKVSVNITIIREFKGEYPLDEKLYEIIRKQIIQKSA